MNFVNLKLVILYQLKYKFNVSDYHLIDFTRYQIVLIKFYLSKEQVTNLLLLISNQLIINLIASIDMKNFKF